MILKRDPEKKEKREGETLVLIIKKKKKKEKNPFKEHFSTHDCSLLHQKRNNFRSTKKKSKISIMKYENLKINMTNANENS